MNDSEPTDADLIRELRTQPTEDAFRQLVERHLPLVWSAARRMLADEPVLAEDVVQRVFTDLARRVPRLRPDGSLGAWLHRHTWFRATAARRAERRRRAREKAAATTMNDTPPAADDPWTALAPALDAALATLSEVDRRALVLRFFETRSFRSVGEVLGLSEDSARKRVTRALERLRTKLGRRGVTLGATMLATTLAARGAEAAPAGMARLVSSTAWSGRSAGAGAAWSVAFRKAKWPVAATVAAVSVAAIAWLLREPASSASAMTVASPPPPAPPLPPGQPFHLRLAIFSLAAHESVPWGEDLPADAADAGALLPTWFERTATANVVLDQPADEATPLPPVMRLHDATRPGETGHLVLFTKLTEVTFSTRFGGGSATEPTQPKDREMRAVGTSLRAVVSRPRADGLWPVTLKGTQTVRPHTWRTVPHVIDIESRAKSATATQVPIFHQATLDVAGLLAPHRPELIATLSLPPVSEPPGEARQLFVFLTLDPAP